MRREIGKEKGREESPNANLSKTQSPGTSCQFTQATVAWRDPRDPRAPRTELEHGRARLAGGQVVGKLGVQH